MAYAIFAIAFWSIEMAKLLFIRTFSIISEWSAVFSMLLLVEETKHKFNGKIDNTQTKLGEWNVSYYYVKVLSVAKSKQFTQSM